jgi:hypothetical protein
MMVGRIAAAAWLILAPAVTAQDLASLLEGLAKHTDVLKPVYDRGFTRTTRIEELDKSGRPESVIETVERVTRNDGREERQLLRAVRDGKDVTEELRQKRAERAASGKSGGQQEVSFSAQSPFRRSEQPKYRFSLAGRDPGNPGRVRIAFEPKGQPSEAVVQGEAVVDAAAAVPVLIRFRPSVYPKHVQKMNMELQYGVSSELGPLLSAISVDAEGGLLFIKKRYRTKSTFSDYSAGSGSAP